MDRAWRPNDIETESLSRLGASVSFSAAASMQPQVATAYTGDTAGIGCGLLAVAKEQRRRLRKERTALEFDKTRWFEDSTRAYDPACVDAASIRSRELLAEVKVALDARAQKVSE